MKKNYYIVLSALSLCSCQQIEAPVSIDPNEIRFEFSLPTSTRVTSTDFEVNDKIGVYATTYSEGDKKDLQLSGNWINNECLCFDGSVWNAERKIVWPEDNLCMDIYAYYPYSANIDSIDEQTFSVALDQRTESNGEVLGGYEASDFLWAVNKGVKKTAQTPEPVSMQFKHMCSKVVIQLVKGEDFAGSFPDDAMLIIHNTVTEGRIDFSTGSISKYIFGGPEDIICHRVNPNDSENPVYEAIVIPQRASSRRPLFEYYTGKVSYLAEDTYVFHPGKCYVYTMTISSSPEQTIINIGGKIDGWD